MQAPDTPVIIPKQAGKTLPLAYTDNFSTANGQNRNIWCFIEIKMLNVVLSTKTGDKSVGNWAVCGETPIREKREYLDAGIGSRRKEGVGSKNLKTVRVS
ncbi:hypothetical protein DXU84_23935 [Rahnella sp. RcJ3]|nr:hypothetical protein [Rahnella sp. RcJ3]